ncbi:MAG: efflux RND transporter periplasmic adaptor subunit [Planctomycetes bacterium]|nr:efflux RND transporter periplasmic adaptor subunit [Planctomycetota bacterium]
MDLQNLKIDRGSKPTTARRRSGPWPLRLLLLGVIAAAVWLFWRPLTGFADRMRLPAVRTLLVTETAPATAAAVRGTAANGYVVAARRAALSSDVPGRIVELAVREGSVVKRGDIVARLYADEFRAALQRAEADLAVATAAVQRAERSAAASGAELDQARAAAATARAQADEGRAGVQWLDGELQRVQDLLRTGIGSDRDLLRARTDLDGGKARLQALQSAAAAADAATALAARRTEVAAADLEVATAQRAAAAAARDLAQATLDKTDVRAPFDGIVVLKDAEVGEVVSPNVQGGSNARGAVCTMVDFDSLEVQANVPETTLASVRLGAPADMFLDAFPDDRYDGQVDRIWPTADRQKATVEVRVKLLRKDERLRPEMGVRVVFRAADAAAPVADATAAPRAILVPEQALVQQDGRTGAFLVERDTVRFVAVTAGERRAGRVAIDAGLTAGQTIVLDPPAELRDGSRVRLADQ